jgi:hypothetical protein
MSSPAAPSTPPLTAAARFAFIIEGLRAAVAARIADFPVTGPMVVYICTRLTRLNQKFQALAALIIAGKLRPERPYRPRASIRRAPPDPAAATGPWPVWRLLPTRRFAWLCMVAHNRAGPANAAIYGYALRALLGEPEMVALLAATPRMAKLLRPLCWGLGIEASMLRSRRVASPAAVEAVSAADPDRSDQSGAPAPRARVPFTANRASAIATGTDRRLTFSRGSRFLKPV